MHRMLPRFIALGAVLAGGSLLAAASTSPRIVAIRTTPEQRAAYLAHALIWKEPAPVTPTELLDGPRGFPYSFKQADTGDGVRCTYASSGQDMGGKSPKFLCRTDDGKQLRLKYWDPKLSEGSREVFATVAAARLMWALGFEAPSVMPAIVTCKGCPANPASGQGETADRRYVALMMGELNKPLIISDKSEDQGWAWEELQKAIDSLPAGEERARQEKHMAALTLLGVLIQHGDRKPEQQVLYCDSEVNASAGSLSPVKDKDGVVMLVENDGMKACAKPAVAVVDVGTTFGGAGKMSKQSTAKMNLKKWTEKPVFKEEAGQCHGDLTVSMTAGEAGRPDPVISEEGRQFLAQLLQRLTPEHVQAMFESARVDQLGDDDDDKGKDEARAAVASVAKERIVAWVAAFQEKARQIEARRCAN